MTTPFIGADLALSGNRWLDLTGVGLQAPTIAASATVAGSLSRDLGATGSVAGESTAGASLGVALASDGASVGDSSVVAELLVVKPLAGVSVGSSSVVVTDLLTLTAVEGVSQGSAGVDGDLFIAAGIPLAGAATSVGTVVADLLVRVEDAGAAAGGALTSGDLTVRVAGEQRPVRMSGRSGSRARFWG